jgi:hypothetical protein
VIEDVHLRGVGEAVVGLVIEEGVILPRIPQAADHLDELGGPAIALGVAVSLVEAVVEAGPATAVVTTFQPARPLLILSSPPNCRARLNGSE